MRIVNKKLLNALVKSIDRLGQQNPCHVEKINERYFLTDGMHRVLACHKLKRKVSVIIIKRKRCKSCGQKLVEPEIITAQLSPSLIYSERIMKVIE